MRRSLPIADNGLIFFVSGATGFGSDFQSFLAGAPFWVKAVAASAITTTAFPATPGLRRMTIGSARRSTLNLGIRNEFVGAPYDTLCHTGNTDPTLATTTGQPLRLSQVRKQVRSLRHHRNPQSAGLNNEYATVWEPRIGFAYDVAGRHTTSIRGGYGIYSVREDLGAVDNLAIVPPTYPFLVGFLPGAGQSGQSVCAQRRIS